MLSTQTPPPRFQLWQLEVGDEEVRNDFKHVKPVDSPLSAPWAHGERVAGAN